MKDTSWVLIGLCVCALVAGGLYLLNRVDEEDLPAPSAVVATPRPQPSAAPKIRYPIPEIEVESSTPPPELADADAAAAPRPTPTPLPALENSDAPLLAEATPLFGERGLPDFLLPRSLINHIVVTVDNLDREPIRLEFRPLRYVPGQLPVDTVGAEEPQLFLSQKNTTRYTPYVQALSALDPALVAAVYRRYYPLFQQSYQSLGYPKAYFNDRLVAVIDHLLATPEVAYPIAVVQPKVYFEFADPDLEKRSWGQKVLIRIGPAHAATVKSFLRALRTELTAAEQP